MQTSHNADRRFFILNGVVSTAALSFLTWLLLFHRGESVGETDLRFMPAVNAGLNATAAVLLILGRLAIVKKNIQLHRSLMVSSFAASAVFLVGYVAYHAVHGDTKFGGQGSVRSIYFGLLISHVLLSVLVVPLSLSAFYFAFTKQFVKHVKVTRILHPVWLYVSVTGVVVFFMLRPYYLA